MPTTTTTYSFNKPVVGADEDDWGGYLNGNWDSVDDLLDGTTPVTGIDINSGTLDGVTIGGTTAGAGTFTTLTANTSITGTLATAAQTNITSVGTLTSLGVSGDLTVDTNTLHVDSTNNRVGVGTTSPNAPSAIVATTTTYEGLELITPSGDGTGEFHIGVHQNGSTAGRSIVFKRGGSDGMDTESMRISADGRVGIGTSSPSNPLTVDGDNNSIRVRYSGNTNFRSDYVVASNGQTTVNSYKDGDNTWQPIRLQGSVVTNWTNGSERMRIDSSGNLLVGKTSSNGQVQGCELRDHGQAAFTNDGGNALQVRRLTSDGEIIQIVKDVTQVGSIGVDNTDNITLSGNSTHSGLMVGTDHIVPYANGSTADGTEDLGYSSIRWRNLYLSGGVYLGGTGSANKLDDYEEGTWTPDLQINGSSSGVTYTSRNGVYIKVGHVVHLFGHITMQSKGTNTGSVSVGGLPFYVAEETANTGLESGGYLVPWYQGSSGLYSLSGITQSGTQYMTLRGQKSATNDLSNQLTDSNITNAFGMRFSLTYHSQ